jgi:tripartite-type tricarboxylate transporter receptor subunit TctC
MSPSPPPRRALLLAGATTLLSPAIGRAAWPDRPLRLVVPFAPGGNADLVARSVAPLLAERLGQPVIVENRAGAGGSVAATAIARARWDGTTLLVGSNGPLAINPAIQPNLGYDPVRDFQPLGLIVRTPLTLAVHRLQPPRDLAALVALARTRPGAVAFGTAGIASTGHLTLEMLNAATGAGLAHVPYAGGGALIADLVSGTLAGTCVEISTILPLHRDGAVRLLAVTAASRAAAAPDIPTAEEAGLPGFLAASFIGLVAPAGAPAEALAALQAALGPVVTDPALRQRLELSGSAMATPEDSTPAGFAAFLRREAEWTREAAIRAGLRPA